MPTNCPLLYTYSHICYEKNCSRSASMSFLSFYLFFIFYYNSFYLAVCEQNKARKNNTVCVCNAWFIAIFHRRSHPLKSLMTLSTRTMSHLNFLLRSASSSSARVVVASSPRIFSKLKSKFRYTHIFPCQRHGLHTAA